MKPKPRVSMAKFQNQKRKKSKKKNRILSLASLNDIIHLPSAMEGDARALSAWCDTCMGPAAHLDDPHCSASPWGAPGGAGSWYSCLGGKNKTTLQRDAINKCGLAHVYPPTTWWQSLSSGVVALGANRNKCDTLQREVTWYGGQFLLLPVSFLERKPQEKIAKRESFFWEEDHWQTLKFPFQVGAENLGAGMSVMKCGASSMSKHPRNLRWGSQTISKGGDFYGLAFFMDKRPKVLVVSSPGPHVGAELFHQSQAIHSLQSTWRLKSPFSLQGQGGKVGGGGVGLSLQWVRQMKKTPGELLSST